VQRPCTHARCTSTNTIEPRTIEHIYNGILNCGGNNCSEAYTTSLECEGEGCVRFAQSSAKNVEMQKRAQRKRDYYWHMLEYRLSPGSHRHGMQENIVEHVKLLRARFFKLCELEKEAILLMQQAQKIDDLELYKKTFTL